MKLILASISALLLAVSVQAIPSPAADAEAFCTGVANGDSAKLADCKKVRQIMALVRAEPPQPVPSTLQAPSYYPGDYLKEGEGRDWLKWFAKRQLGLA